MTNFDSLALEVERLTGRSILPVQVDNRIYFTPLAVLLVLIIFRPSFLYKDKHFDFSSLFWYTVLLSVLVIGGYYAYMYRHMLF